MKRELSDLEKRMVAAISRTWSMIAYDVLAAVAEDKGKHIDAVTISRSDALETTYDSMHAYGNDKEAVEAFMKLSQPNQKKLGKLALPHTRYGT
jgi:hypothetical protein